MTTKAGGPYFHCLPLGMVSAVRQGTPAMRAVVLELPRLEEGDDCRLTVGTDHDLALDRDVGGRVLRIAGIIGVLYPDHFTHVAGNCVGGMQRWLGLASA